MFVDQTNAASAATFFLRLIDTTERSPDVLVDISFEMKAHLLIKLMVHFVFTSERAPAT
jgi:hypothetical protein